MWKSLQECCHKVKNALLLGLDILDDTPMSTRVDTDTDVRSMSDSLDYCKWLGSLKQAKAKEAEKTKKL